MNNHTVNPYDIMGYVYEADIHCQACTEGRFPNNTETNPAVDNEGNPIAPLFAEYHINHELCGSCGGPLF